MIIAIKAIGMAPAKMNVVPSVEFVPRIIISPSVGAPINDPNRYYSDSNNKCNSNTTNNNR